jgi:hypothetical protein
LTRTRPILAFLLAMALVAIPAIAAAATVPVAGTTTGTATVRPPTADVGCNPTASTGPADFLCEFDVEGTFNLTELGAGTFTETTLLDWSFWTSAEPCAELTGSLVMTTADGTLTVEVLDTSRVCETSSPLVHTASVDATILSGTGAYAGATGTLGGDGTLTATTAPGVYDAIQALAGSVTLPDPPVPTPAPTTDPSMAPSVAPSVAPSIAPDSATTASTVPSTGTAATSAATLPDTASMPASSLPAVLILVGLIASAAATRILSRRIPS